VEDSGNKFYKLKMKYINAVNGSQIKIQLFLQFLYFEAFHGYH
jgi:hypothetical protein